jgi:uncharacterized peroxidase-related enzyme
MSNTVKLNLEAKTLDTAAPMAKTILEETEKGLGFVPNMYAYFANSPALLKSYTHSYTLFRQNTDFNGVEQEVVFLTISRENGCHYCVAAHSFVGDNMTNVPKDVTNAIRDNTEIPDAKLNALSEMTKALVIKHGNISEADVENFLAAGYSETQILDIILALSAKIISNYANHIFHTPVDEVFSGRVWEGK